MTQSFICRKRCRSDCDEESSEFTPLSKRINNLHINNTLLKATATIETQCHNHHDNLNQLCHHAIGLNGAINQSHEQNQWTGGILANNINQHLDNVNINGRVMDGSDVLATSIQANLQQQPPLVMQHYNPDLSETENPYYYENNRLLFTLYMERLQRTNNCNYVIN